AMRIADQRAAIAASTQAIDVEQVTLVRGSHGADDGELHIPVDGGRQGRAQDDLGAHADQGARYFWEPGVIANGNAETARIRHVEDKELVARGNAFFVGLEHEHLAITPNHDAVRVD